MTGRPFRAVAPARWVELILMLAVVAGFANLAASFWSHGYLPAPFVSDVDDTFMDWFNTAYYAHNPGAYDVWGSVYAPLSFAFLKVFGDGACYHSHAKDARDCDVFGIATISALYLLAAASATLAFYKNDRRTALFRSVGYACSLPLLYAFERGNIILLASIFFNLLFGHVIVSRRWTAIAAAMLVNLKTYLLLPVLVFAMQRQWRKFELCLFAAVFLYLATLFVIGSGTPLELQHNITVWFRVASLEMSDQEYYSTTYAPYLKLDLARSSIPDLVDRSTIDLARTMIEFEILASRALAIVCIFGAWLYPRILSETRVVFFLLMQSFVAQSPGGYGLALIVFLVFMETPKGVLSGLALGLAYVACIPTDHVISVLFEAERYSWLAGRSVDFAFAMTLGVLLRPGLIVVILWSLALDSLIDLYRVAKGQSPLLGLASPVPAPSTVAA